MCWANAMATASGIGTVRYQELVFKGQRRLRGFLASQLLVDSDCPSYEVDAFTCETKEFAGPESSPGTVITKAR
jgi:hypothetical protein